MRSAFVNSYNEAGEGDHRSKRKRSEMPTGSPSSTTDHDKRRSTRSPADKIADEKKARVLAIVADVSLTQLEKAAAIKEIMMPAQLREVTESPEHPKFVFKSEMRSYYDQNNNLLGCDHYQRKCKIMCFTCKQWWTCRQCHDAASDHVLPRTKTEMMLCMVCGSVSPVGQHCNSEQCAGTPMARYYCDKCKFHNDCGDAIYHCDGCGLCRFGEGLGIDFAHCKRCATCVAMKDLATHPCQVDSEKRDCPVCGDYMFGTTNPVITLRCGHSMHEKCFKMFVLRCYKCPLCRSCIGNMSETFQRIHTQIQNQPMPSEYVNAIATCKCDDCGAQFEAPYHYLGHQCTQCKSYNTLPINTRNMPDSMAELQSE